jgi:hypothetical protein
MTTPTAAAAPSPLIAPRIDTTPSYGGIFIAEDIATLIEGFKTNDWIDVTIGGVAATLDAVSLVIDPLGQVAAMGAAFLMEHVKPLSDALDFVAGDPDQIAAYSQTWRNAADSVDRAGTDLQAAVDRETLDWTGAAGDAYRAHMNEQLNAILGLRNASTAMSEIVQGVGLMVSFARGLVRDLVAQFLATLAVRLPTWLAAEGLTVGLATPAVVAQAAELIATWTARVARVLRGIAKTLQKLLPILRHLDELIRSLVVLLKRLARKAPHGEHGPHGPHSGGGPHEPGLHEPGLHEPGLHEPGLAGGEAPHRTPDEIDQIIEGIREESTVQPGETVSGGTGARGTAGEQGMGFAYSQEQGWAFLEGPSGTSGHASNAAGFDGVAFRTDGPPEIHILDNKSLAREGNVGSATAITDNLGQNLDALAQRAADPRLRRTEDPGAARLDLAGPGRGRQRPATTTQCAPGGDQLRWPVHRRHGRPGPPGSGVPRRAMTLDVQ